MIKYTYPGLFFKKMWYWFDQPHDVADVDVVNFFSYEDVLPKGFSKNVGCTTVIDLSQDIDFLWGAMRKKFIRAQIKKGEKKGVTIQEVSDWRQVQDVYKIFRTEKGLAFDKPSVFSKGKIYGAYYMQELVAFGVFMEDDLYSRAYVLASTRYNEVGATREIVGQANRMLIWHAINDTKLRGKSILDLGGIAPESNERGDQLLMEFKEAFGGSRKACYYYHKVYSSRVKVLQRLRKIIKGLYK